MGSKSPAFQFYAAEYLADENVAVMTLEEEGAYIRALSYCWREGSIPSDNETLSRLLKGASNQTLTVVRKCFNQSSTLVGRLVHPRLDSEREKQAAWREKSSIAGRLSGNARRNKRLQAEPTFNQPLKGGCVLVEPNANSSSSSSSSSLKYSMRGSRIPEDFSPSEDHAELARKMSVDLALEFEKFKDFWKAKAGKDATKLDWPATLRNWIRNAKPSGGSNGTNQPSPAKQRLDRNRQALAEAAIRRGWYKPDGNPGENAAAVADAGQRGVNRGIPDRPGATEPEILPPKGGSGT